MNENVVPVNDEIGVLRLAVELITKSENKAFVVPCAVIVQTIDPIWMTGVMQANADVDEGRADIE